MASATGSRRCSSRTSSGSVLIAAPGCSPPSCESHGRSRARPVVGPHRGRRWRWRSAPRMIPCRRAGSATNGKLLVVGAVEVGDQRAPAPGRDLVLRRRKPQPLPAQHRCRQHRQAEAGPATPRPPSRPTIRQRIGFHGRPPRLPWIQRCSPISRAGRAASITGCAAPAKLADEFVLRFNRRRTSPRRLPLAVRPCAPSPSPTTCCARPEAGRISDPGRFSGQSFDNTTPPHQALLLEDELSKLRFCFVSFIVVPLSLTIARPLASDEANQRQQVPPVGFPAALPRLWLPRVARQSRPPSPPRRPKPSLTTEFPN